MKITLTALLILSSLCAGAQTHRDTTINGGWNYSPAVYRDTLKNEHRVSYDVPGGGGAVGNFDTSCRLKGILSSGVYSMATGTNLRLYKDTSIHHGVYEDTVYVNYPTTNNHSTPIILKCPPYKGVPVNKYSSIEVIYGTATIIFPSDTVKPIIKAPMFIGDGKTVINYPPIWDTSNKYRVSGLFITGAPKPMKRGDTTTITNKVTSDSLNPKSAPIVTKDKGTIYRLLADTSKDIGLHVKGNYGNISLLPFTTNTSHLYMHYCEFLVTYEGGQIENTGDGVEVFGDSLTAIKALVKYLKKADSSASAAYTAFYMLSNFSYNNKTKLINSITIHHPKQFTDDYMRFLWWHDREYYNKMAKKLKHKNKY